MQLAVGLAAANTGTAQATVNSAVTAIITKKRVMRDLLT